MSAPIKILGYVFVGVAAWLVACGGGGGASVSEVECGEGTTLVESVCEVSEPVRCGEGTVLDGEECVPEDPPGPPEHEVVATDGAFGSFADFSPMTRAASMGSALRISLVSSTDTPINCSSGTAYENEPTAPSSQVYLRLGTTYCSAETTIRIDGPACATEWEAGGLAEACMVFRSWNLDGELTAELLATDGAVTLTPRFDIVDDCVVDIEGVFDETTFRDEFVIPRPNALDYPQCQ